MTFHSWKFAANAVWEEALSVDNRQPIDLAAIEQWVARSPQNVAFEAIFSKDGIPATMYGVRLTSFPKSEQVKRIKDMVSKSDVIKMEADFEKIVAEIFPELKLSFGKPEALNIGIVSQWYSFGPELLWDQRTEKPLTLDELKEKAPRFLKPTLNPAAIEFWNTDPIDHWYKIYVSDQGPDGYVINPAKYRVAIPQL